MKKRNFDLSEDFFYKSIEKGVGKELASIRIYEPDKGKVRNATKEGNGIEGPSHSRT